MIKTHKTKLKSYIVKYTNSEEFHTIKSEIFGNQIYNFRTESNVPVIIDCGSHIGISILYFKDLYPQAKIYGFEPNPHIFPILEENVFVNNLKDIEIYNMAVDSQSGRRTMYIDDENQWYSTSSFKRGSWIGNQITEPVEVNTVNINEILEKLVQTEGKIDLLKLDIEGAEVSLIKHIQGNLDKVNQIVLEHHPLSNGSFQKVLEILKKHYSNFQYNQSGKVVSKPDPKKLAIIHASK